MIFEASEKLLKKSLNIEEDLFGKLLALLSVIIGKLAFET